MISRNPNKGIDHSSLPVLLRQLVKHLFVLLAALGMQSVAAAETEVHGTAGLHSKVQISLLDGRRLKTELSHLTSRTAYTQSAEKSQTIGLEEIERIDFFAAAAKREVPAVTEQPTNNGLIELADGARLPLHEVEAAGNQLRVIFPEQTKLSPSTVLVSPDAVRSIRFVGRPQNLRKAWQELKSKPADGDRVMVVRGGKSLDYVEGVITKVGGQSIELLLDGESIEAPIDRIYGVTFAVGAAGTPTESQAPVLYATDGIELPAKRLSLDRSHDGFFAVETSGGLQLSVPKSMVTSIDYSAGRVDYISDFEPTAVDWNPLFASPTGLASDRQAARLLGPLRRDRGFWSLQLTLPSDRANGQPVTFKKGLAIKPDADLRYRLEDAYRQLTFVAGIAPQAAPGRQVTLQVFADEHPLLQQTITSQQPAQSFRLPLSSPTELRFSVRRESGSLDATLHLGDARLVK